jgi:putative membrane-bound dehydrogenase-like protein
MTWPVFADCRSLFVKLRRNAPTISPNLTRRCPLLLVLVWTGFIISLTSADTMMHPTFVPSQIVADYFSEGCAVGDLNSDGHNDVIYGPYWFAGPGFQERHKIYEPKPQPREGYADHFFAWVYDFDADGHPDILAVGLPGTPAYIYHNPGPNAGDILWERHQVLDSVWNESPQFVDVTGDARPELVCAHDGYYGYAEFRPQQPFTAWDFRAVSDKTVPDPFGHGLGVGDLHGDGPMEILVTDGWYERPPSPDSKNAAAGRGRWLFHAHPFSDSYGGADILVYDVDGDGDSDVITSLAAHDFGIAWFEQSRNGDAIQFKRHMIVGSKPEENRYGIVFSEPHALRLVDLDGDGLRDFVTGKTYYSHHQQSPQWDAGAVVYWFRLQRNKEGVEWIPHLMAKDSGIGRQIAEGDLNGDRAPDLALGGMKGCHVLIQKRLQVTPEEWTRLQPKPVFPNVAESESAPASVPSFSAMNGDGKQLNFSFETGTLEDWTVDGTAFLEQPIHGDTVRARRADMSSQHDGEYWVGGYEKRQDESVGTLTSVDFEVTHRYGSFLVGGGGNFETRVELCSAETGEPFFRTAGQFTEDMRRVAVDLQEYLGKKIRIRLVDEAISGWGHLNFDSFQLHDDPPVAVVSTMKAPAVPTQMAGLTPAEGVRQMRVPAGFSVQLCASEPDVQQPIAMAIDDRGRLWVAEAYEYPQRAATDRGRDRILIFNDRDGDGKFDERKIFAEGLNLVSGLEVGFGGVWVGAAPFLFFIPDANGDDVPDAPPRVLLDGWGYEDTHETLNAFIWGPDGWLYGCHGVFTHSRVGKPGTPDDERTPLNAAIWRYHPVRHTFEVFAHGTSNPWGVDFNDWGQAFCTACVIPHLYHVIPGARYQRQAGVHFNAFTFDDIKTIADHSHFVGHDPWAAIGKSDDQGGGHAHAGAMIYLGGVWPPEYRNQIFMNNIHGQRLNMDRLLPNKSGFIGSHGPDFLLTGDMASQMINLRYGPDGQVYVIDWYDMQACHTNESSKHDRSNGRIYKVSYDAKSSEKKIDLQRETDKKLVERLLEPNEWYVRHSRRILQERAAAGKLDQRIATRLRELATEHSDPTRRLRAYWLMHVTGLLDDPLLTNARKDPEAAIRGWGVRLAVEDMERRAPDLAKDLQVLSREDKSPVVRLEIASALQRMPEGMRWEILSGLASHTEDVDDPNLPLMIWYAAEPLVAVDPPRALYWGMDAGKAIPILRDFTMRRIALLGTGASLDLLTEVLGESEDREVQASAMMALQLAVAGKKDLPAPKGWEQASLRLLEDQDPRRRIEILSLGVMFGDLAAKKELREAVVDPRSRQEIRLQALTSILRTMPDAKDSLSTVFECLADPGLRETAIRGLANFDDQRVPGAILAIFPQLNPTEKRAALVSLCGRASYAQVLLSAMEQGAVDPKGLSADLLRQLSNLRDPRVTEQLQRVWGVYQEPAGDKKEQIERYKRLAENETLPPPDPMLGRAVFAQTCQKCHLLYGVGNKIGPDLTGSNRADLDYLLSNMIDPSGVMAKEYQQTVLTTVGGRVLTGIVLGEDQNMLRLQTVDAMEQIAISHIEDRVAIEKSMMPDDQLGPMSDHEVRSLIAYLRGGQQNPLLALPTSPPVLFNGTDLQGWHGNDTIWSVEQGEIVGRSHGLERNEFLMSDICGEDFTLTLKVWLKGNSGNSGIQFRSESFGDRDIRGYQADIGPSWWGMLYEEHGRGVLAESKVQVPIQVDGWNTYRVEAKGSRIRMYLNEQLCVDLEDPEGARRGIFALQVHSGDATEVRFKDLKLEVHGDPGRTTSAIQ